MTELIEAMGDAGYEAHVQRVVHSDSPRLAHVLQQLLRTAVRKVRDASFRIHTDIFLLKLCPGFATAPGVHLACTGVEIWLTKR